MHACISKDFNSFMALIISLCFANCVYFCKVENSTSIPFKLLIEWEMIIKAIFIYRYHSKLEPSRPKNNKAMEIQYEWKYSIYYVCGSNQC